MEVGGDTSTQRPLLLREDEEAGAAADDSSQLLAGSPQQAQQQQAWRRSGPRAERAAYGLLDPAGPDAPGEDDAIQEGGLDGEAETELLGRVEDGFYECEEEDEEEHAMLNHRRDVVAQPEPTGIVAAAATVVATAAVEVAGVVAAVAQARTPRAWTPRAASSSAGPLLASSSSSATPLQPAADARELRLTAGRGIGGDEDDEHTETSYEMHGLMKETSGSPRSSSAAGGASASSSRGCDAAERHCFICLQDEEKDDPLVACCTTCYARVHVRCWREWRNNQRITALRSRLLGLRMQTNHLLRCTICKSGTALVAGEEDGLEWMNELLCGGGEQAQGEDGGNAGRLGGLAHAVTGRRDDSDEDGDTQLEDLIDMKTCLALVAYLGVIVLVLVVACVLIVMQRFYAGDVILCCIIALYELSVLQIVAMAVARRRSTTPTPTRGSTAAAAATQDLESGVP